MKGFIIRTMVLCCVIIGSINGAQAVVVNYHPNGGAFSGKSVDETTAVTYTRGYYEKVYYSKNINIQFPNKEPTGETGWMFGGWYTTSGDWETQTIEWRGVVDELEALNDSGITVYARWLPFRDLPIEIGGSTVIIMDRNLGAMDNYRTSSDSYGFFYQWGNNYGFSSDPNAEIETYHMYNDAIAGESGFGIYVNGYGPGNYFSNPVFYIGEISWIEGGDGNIRGGAQVSNPDEYRQGPCPNGYHIPDKLERQAAYNLYCNNDCTLYNFLNDFKLPAAGSRSSADATVDYQGNMGYYWTSSPTIKTFGTTNYPYVVSIYSSFGIYGDTSNSRGLSLRCFKNSSSQSLTFIGNEGPIESNITQTVRWRETGEELPSDQPKENAVFDGWYTTSGFVEGTKVKTNAIFSDSPVTLYAKRVCNLGYEENETGTGCVLKKNTVFFETNRGPKVEPITFPEGSKITPPNMKKFPGYIVEGWYLDEDLTEKFDFDTFDFATANVDSITLYAKWKYDIDFEDLELYFLTNTGEIRHYTIMDRNLGATEIYNQKTGTMVNTNSLGYHYQWGNNYGFMPCNTNNCNYFPGGESYTLNKRESKLLWSPSTLSRYISNIFRSFTYGNYPYTWMEDSVVGGENENMWGGKGDTETSNGTGTTFDRQGACPDGYYIPSILDWNNIFKSWKNSSKNLEAYQLASDFLLSFAGYRHSNYDDLHGQINNIYNKIIDQGSSARYWSSSPVSSSAGRAYNIGIYTYQNRITNITSSDNDSMGYSVRCFKTFPSSSQSLVVHAKGGIGAVIVFTGKVGEGKITALGTPSRGNYIFLGWFDAENGGNEIKKGSTVPTDLYARWGCEDGYVENEEKTGCIKCNPGYVENDEKTACEKIRVEFDANGGKFENGESGISREINIELLSEAVTNIVHTINLTDEGEQRDVSNPPSPTNGCSTDSDGKYCIQMRSTGYVQIPGAERLKIFIKYGGSPYCTPGAIGIWTGEHTDYSPTSNSNSAIAIISSFPSYGEISEFELEIGSDSVSIVQQVNGRGCPSYGYHMSVLKPAEYDIAYPDDAFDDISQPSWEGHKFVGWYLSGGTEFDTGSVSTGEITYVYAKWECAQGYVDKQGQCVKEETKPSGGSSGGGGGGGGGGSSSSSCKNLPTNAVANNSSTPSSNTNYYYSTNTSKVCTFQCKSGYTRNEEKETCDKISDTQTTSGTTVKKPEGTGNNTKAETGNNTEIQTGSKIDTSEQVPQEDKQNTQDSTTNNTQQQQTNSTSSTTYSEEFQEAYEFAHENGITTKNTIESADMNGKLTRIAMAKMLSQYAMNVLGKKPANIVVPKFSDVTDKQNSDYDDGVGLAYQLGIMGQNMPNNKFRPDDEVTRAEFATALSRMLYNTSDGEYKSTSKYYTNHMKKLKEEGIITKDDPKMKELRGYVMIMLMRSAK